MTDALVSQEMRTVALVGFCLWLCMLCLFEAGYPFHAGFKGNQKDSAHFGGPPILRQASVEMGMFA